MKTGQYLKKSTPSSKVISKKSNSNLPYVDNRVRNLDDDTTSVWRGNDYLSRQSRGNREVEGISEGYERVEIPNFVGLSAKLWGSENNPPPIQPKYGIGNVGDSSGDSEGLLQADSTQGTSSAPIQAKEAETANKTGLPDRLKTGIENLSGYSMDDVKVHYNSDKPSQLQAHAYAQGTDIHVAPGQEKHLPHEAWHMVQQKQGRVKSPLHRKGKENINDDEGLEKEADVMGQRAFTLPNSVKSNSLLGSDSGEYIKRNRATHPKNAIPLQLKPNSKSTEHDDVKSFADPFQILATQFDAKYDIYIFQDEIKKYNETQKKLNKYPVFEFRMYDGVNPAKVDVYMEQAKKFISEVVGDMDFSLTYSWLRDETKDTNENEANISTQIYTEYIGKLQSFINNSKNERLLIYDKVVSFMTETYGEIDVVTLVSEIFNIESKLKTIKAETFGKIMLPIPEAISMLTSTNEDLYNAIVNFGSIHEKLVAFLVLVGKANEWKDEYSSFTELSKETIDETKKGRGRSNSQNKPEEVAFANLVWGNEEQNAQLVHDVVEKAFKKGATVVHVIVEYEGMEKGETRYERTKKKLEEHWYDIVKEKEIAPYEPSESQPAAQQSGIELQEPLKDYKSGKKKTKKTRKRMKMEIRRPLA